MLPSSAGHDTTLVAASPCLGFCQDHNQIQAWDPVTKEKVGSIDCKCSPSVIANLQDRVLCVAGEAVVHAYRMDASLQHLWTVSFQNSITRAWPNVNGMIPNNCLVTSSDRVIYTGKIIDSTGLHCLLAMVDKEGNIVYQKHNGLSISYFVNTQKAIYTNVSKGPYLPYFTYCLCA